MLTKEPRKSFDEETESDSDNEESWKYETYHVCEHMELE